MEVPVPNPNVSDHVYGIDFVSFHDCSVAIWNCSDCGFYITVLEDATIHDVLMLYNKLAHPRINVTTTVIVQHSLTLNRIVEFVSKQR
jgi:hypothetical protein